MKKILLVFAVLALCSFTPQVGKKYVYMEDVYEQPIRGKVVEVDGMRILILSKDDRSNSPITINLTKDKLEVEKNKLEIEYLKKQLGKK